MIPITNRTLNGLIRIDSSQLPQECVNSTSGECQRHHSSCARFHFNGFYSSINVYIKSSELSSAMFKNEIFAEGNYKYIRNVF